MRGVRYTGAMVSIRRLEGVAQHEDDGVAAEEHLGDEAVAVHGLGLLLA